MAVNTATRRWLSGSVVSAEIGIKRPKIVRTLRDPGFRFWRRSDDVGSFSAAKGGGGALAALLGAGTGDNLLGWLLNVRACITSESYGCRSAAVTSLATLTPTKVDSDPSGHLRHHADGLHDIQALRGQHGGWRCGNELWKMIRGSFI